MMSLSFALRNCWSLVQLNYDCDFALVERTRVDGLRERALARSVDDADSEYAFSFNRHPRAASPMSS
jgi:hypothetical protein